MENVRYKIEGRGLESGECKVKTEGRGLESGESHFKGPLYTI